MTKTIEENYAVKVVRDTGSNCVLSQEWWNVNQQKHNPIGPAFVEYDAETGEAVRQEWLVNGQLHRPEQEGPAVITHDLESGVTKHQYWQNDRLNRDGGPAIVIFEENSGKVLQQRFFKNGAQHAPGMKLDQP